MPRIDSYLACPETLVGVFTQALTQLPDAVRDWPQLPIAVHFEVGSSQLSVGEFAALEPDDLIFLERGPWLEDGSVMIRLAANFGWRASVEGDVLTLQSLEMGMAEEELFEEGTAPLESLDELPITLSFDLGRQTLPYKEIKMLQPGYTFELAKTQEKPVNLRANGRTIGKGELVQVGDYLGVRVIELYPHDND
jgi:type III secretion protein Q